MPQRAVLIAPNYSANPTENPEETGLAGARPEWATMSAVELGETARPLFRQYGEGVLLVDDRAGGMALGMDDGWITVPGGKDARVYVGSLANIGWCPLIVGGPLDTLAAFDLYHRLVGVPYHRSPGASGLGLLQKNHPRSAGKTAPVVWETPGPHENVKRPAFELPYFPTDWHRTDLVDGEKPAPFLVGVDKRRAGLGTLGVMRVARFALRHTPNKRTFDPTQAGWWLVKVPPWNWRRMPDPAGYGPDTQGDGIRWLSTPTIELLNWLAEIGLSQGIRGQDILDSWTSNACRLWERDAKQLETAWQSAYTLAGNAQGYPERPAVLEAVSATYREIPGMWAGANSWCKRPDWFGAHTATGRANMWRAVYKHGKETGVWPVKVDGDKWWFPADHAQGGRTNLKLGNALGEWRLDGFEENP